VVGAGTVEVRLQDGGGSKTIQARNLIVSTGSVPVIPPIDGLKDAGYWTSRDATSLRDLPSSVVVMGGGPVGVEMAQVYARFGVKTTIVNGGDRILGRDHPRSSDVVAAQLQREGVEIRDGVQATAVRTGGAGRIVELSDGSTVEGAELIVAVGRRGSDLRALGLEEAGVTLGERGETSLDEQLRAADGVFVVGDAAGGLQFTHLADYEARVAARAALGSAATADLSSVPRATYTDPETGAVGSTVEEAQAQGIDAFEVSQDFATTAKGYTVEPAGGDLREGAPGHVTAVIDRDRGVLVGAFTAGPGASEYLHMAVLAIKVGTPVTVLADTIGAFPTGGRVMTNVFAEAAEQL
jgi:pyruvate/2-oxoglutarate dehydrogenase complex dihydrolipoamide dehydrogenase (E3) component